MAYREYLKLFWKYEGDVGLATELELEHAGRGMNPQVARRIAEAEYKRKVRILKNENNNGNHKAAESKSRDKRCADSLFE